MIVTTASLMICLAEAGYLNVETHDFKNDNNIYNIADYSIEQICTLLSIINLSMDIGRNFEYFKDTTSNRISFSLKLISSIVDTLGAFSLVNNPEFKNNLLPIISSVFTSIVEFGNFMIDDSKNFKDMILKISNFGNKKQSNLLDDTNSEVATASSDTLSSEQHFVIDMEEEFYDAFSHGLIEGDSDDEFYDTFSSEEELFDDDEKFDFVNLKLQFIDDKDGEVTTGNSKHSLSC